MPRNVPASVDFAGVPAPAEVPPGQESPDMMAMLWQVSPDMMATVGLDGHLSRVNPAWEATLGYTPDELTMQRFVEFLHPDDVDRTVAEGLSLLDSGNPSIRFENRFRCKDGTYRWLSWNSHAAPDRSAVYCVVRDISDRLHHQDVITELNRVLTVQSEHLLDLNRDLVRSNRDLEQFAYIASHDLSGPLRSVSGYVQLIARRYRGRLDSDADEFIEFAVDGVERMQALIRDLLAYARAGVGGEPVTVDCAELVAGVVRAASAAHPQAVFDVGPMPVVLCEPAQLRQVLDNLVSNAAKFVSPDRAPRITVSARALHNAWEFTVADNGIGIDDADRERVFTLFQRLHARGDYAGTGIGLAICQRIVERLGGTISVGRTPELGTQFSFTIASHRGEAVEG